MSSPDSTQALRDTAEVLRVQAAQVRRAFQRAFDAADPIPGVEQITRVSDVLEFAASQRAPERTATLRSHLLGEDVQMIVRTAELLAQPARPSDAAEDAARSSALPSVRAALATIVSARGQAGPGPV